MKDAINSFFEAWVERVRSPILGSIIFVYLLMNWQPLFFLLFEGDVSVQVRLNHYQAFPLSFDWWVCDGFSEKVKKRVWSILPIPLGLLLAVILPWVKFCGAWVAKWPDDKLAQLQEKAANDKRDRKLDQELIEVDKVSAIQVKTAQKEAEIRSITEKASVESAKRLDDLSDDAKERVKAELADENFRSLERPNFDLHELQLNEFLALFAYWKAGGPNSVHEIMEKDSLVNTLLNISKFDDQQRLKVEISEGAKKLEQNGLASSFMRNTGRIYELTSSGYRLSDQFSKMEDEEIMKFLSKLRGEN